jgi:endonuclease YncB( thermonuclease family)
MANGLLEVSGTIDLDQFWPTGQSDADTTKIILEVKEEAFCFRPISSSPFEITHAFDSAIVRGKIKKEAIDKQGRITVRLQGIDAPELYYRPAHPRKLNKSEATAFKAKSAEFRQYFGETATVELRDFLSRAGSNPLPCKVRSAIDYPNEVFDTYGRLVGDIWIEEDDKEINVNHWLIERGWAFPAFYSSMSADEILSIQALAEKAARKRSGIWRKYSKDTSNFDRNLIYRRKEEPDTKADKGPVIIPKIFRRLATWDVSRRAKIVSGSFVAFLKDHSDACYETDDFLTQGLAAGEHRRLDEFIKTKSILTAGPGDLVFQESSSRVTGPNGKSVKW